MIKITRQTHTILTTRHRTRFLILSLLVVVLGGLLTLFWQEQQRQVSHAASDVVVGPPSLSSAAVDAIFTRLGSPMAGTGQTVVAASRSTHIDDAFALGVWWAETNDGMAGVGVGYHNPGGVQASPNYPSTGYTDYPSYAAAETDWFNIVQNRYINRGLTSVYTICYPYVGTSGALNWANKVMNYMSSYRASSPPPPPAVIRKPVPKAAVVVQPKTNTSTTTAKTHKTITPVKKAQTQKITAFVAPPKANINVANTQNMPQGTQLLLIGLGLMVAILLAVPGLLIRRKQSVPVQVGQQAVGSPVSITAFQDQATHGLPVTAALGTSTISTSQLKPFYTNQYSPVLERQLASTIGATGTVNTNQLGFAFDMSPLSTIPASPPFTEHTHILQREPVAVGNGTTIVPQTPLQRIPATPLFQHVPATPLLPHSSQGGLLTRYNMQNKPRRIELTRSTGNTNPRESVPQYREAEPKTETLH
jgi:hypothetical protein